VLAPELIGPKLPDAAPAEIWRGGAPSGPPAMRAERRQQPDVEAVQVQAGAPGAPRARWPLRRCPLQRGPGRRHSVGPAVRERQEVARLADVRSARSAESRKRVYPTWKYHRTKPAVIVKSQQEEAALGEGGPIGRMRLSDENNSV